LKIYISQGSVATQLRYPAISNQQVIANFSQSISERIFLNRLNYIW